jgi:iron complex transport system permease protein
MKIVIDVDKLLKQGRITKEEYTRLRELSREATRRTAFNILVAFGVLATSGGILALHPSGITALVLGFAALVVGGALVYGRFLSVKFTEEWRLLGLILLVVGAVATAGGAYYAFPNLARLAVEALEALRSFYGRHTFFCLLFITMLLLLASVLTKASVLAALSVFPLSAAVGNMSGYWHATYWLEVRQPTLTICLFGALSLSAYWLSLRIPADYEGIAIVFSRTTLFFVNFGFWVGSLWGDRLWLEREYSWPSQPLIPDWVFAIGWAVALVATGMWAARANRRWVVNLVAVFGAIHFYTQLFERLGASPGSFLASGVAALGIAFFIVRYNRMAKRTAAVSNAQ